MTLCWSERSCMHLCMPVLLWASESSSKAVHQGNEVFQNQTSYIFAVNLVQSFTLSSSPARGGTLSCTMRQVTAGKDTCWTWRIWPIQASSFRELPAAGKQAGWCNEVAHCGSALRSFIWMMEGLDCSAMGSSSRRMPRSSSTSSGRGTCHTYM